VPHSSQRKSDHIRPLSIVYNAFGYADSSVLYEIGGTKILCSVTLQPGVPSFLRGSKTGWLTSHYSMLPTSCQQRVEREAVLGKRQGRTIEISRFIGRCLRSVVDTSAIGERTIIIDCDVLQADGGTRTASVSAASCALLKAQERWLKQGFIKEPVLKEPIFGISVALCDGEPVLDPDYVQDSTCSGDYNFVMTRKGDVIEVQGTSEQEPIAWDMIQKMRTYALKGVQAISTYVQALPDTKLQSKRDQKTAPLFSLGKRLGA
jgi:ribonuclease PH